MVHFCFHKPYGVLSQFSSDLPGKSTLADWLDVPRDVYPIGRLDEDSEGLLLLSNDPGQNARWLSQGVEKEYWVQVEGIPTEEALSRLRSGVDIRINKQLHRTMPAVAERMEDPGLQARVPPIRVRQSIPDSWLRLVIREGKNRQVRRMTAAVGFPTLRLVRWRIGPFTLKGLAPGEAIPIDLR